MSDPYRPRSALPFGREHVRRAIELAPFLRFVPKNPLFLGAALMGAVGYVAWRNRDRIARTAGPVVESLRTRPDGPSGSGIH